MRDSRFMMKRARVERRSAIVCAVVIVLLATTGGLVAAQELKLPDGGASVGPDWAELVFPPLALSNTGCARPYSSPPEHEPMRIYYWGAQTRFLDAFTGPTDHFTTLDVRFELPARVPITDARLDSALAVANLDVLESSGEPPMPMNRVRPERAWARREGRSVRIRIEGRKAVEALLRPRADSIDLDWCRRQDTAYVPARRTRIVGGAAGPPQAPTRADSVGAYTAGVEAILADDSSAAQAQLREPPVPAGRDSSLDIQVAFGRMEAAEWAAQSISRMRSWHWRALRWTVDSIGAPTETSGQATSKVFAAFPNQIALTFGILGDTAQVTEMRGLPACLPELHVARPVWLRTHVLARTPSGWRQVRAKSMMATTSCN
jgi:hypothetical protein